MLAISVATAAALFSVRSFWPALLIIAIDGLLLWFIYALKLTTEVRHDSIYIRFFPLFRQTIPFSRISRSYARAYRPIWEYGGWGVRFGWKGRAYNIRGNRGVQLELTDGKRLLIGSQHAEELAQAIATAMSGNVQFPGSIIVSSK